MSAATDKLVGYPLWNVRRARWFLFGLHLALLAVAPAFTITGFDRDPGDPVVVVPVALAIGALQLRHSFAAARGERPRGWRWTLLALILLVYLPMVRFTWDWATMQYFVIASAPMVLRGWPAAITAAAPVLGSTVAGIREASVEGVSAAQVAFFVPYWIAGLVAGGMALYGSVRLVRMADELHAARAELAELAVGRERLRVSRDLHDLLGQSLSAVSLKGDLAKRLLHHDLLAARAEIEGLTQVARDALRGMRAVAYDQHAVSLRTETEAAATLLQAAGIQPASSLAPAWTACPNRWRRFWPGRSGRGSPTCCATARPRPARSRPAPGRAGAARNRQRRRARAAGPGQRAGWPGRARAGAGRFGDHRAHRRQPLPAPGRSPRGARVIGVLVAEDMHMIRGALVALLSLEDDMEVVAELERGDQVVEAALRTRPDVAVLDIDLPGLDGLSAAEQLHERLPECRTLVLTGLSQPGNLLRALKVHVRGFIVKDAPAQTLADGIRRVAAGERVIDPDLVAAALETGSTPLTAREADVLREAEHGIPTEQIAARLSLSPATVRNYLSNAISKVGGRNRIDAIRIARNAGWL